MLIAPTVSRADALAQAPAGSGQLAVLAQASTGPERLEITDSAGAVARTLQRVSLDIDDLAVSQDGTELAYVQNTDRGNDIDAVNITTGKRRTVYQTGLSTAFDGLSWDASGRHIVFSANAFSTKSGAGPASLYVVASTGGRAVRLPIGGVPTSPVVGPNGDIYYTGGVPHQIGIWRADANGTHARRLFASREVEGLAISPDGKEIAFADNYAFQGTNLEEIDAGGGHLRALTPRAKGTNDYSPSWSPDGTQLAFVRSLGRGNGAKEIGEIAVPGAGAPKIITLPDGAAAQSVAWAR